MNKKYYLIIFLFLALFSILISKSSRYTGVNYDVYEKKISNYKKIMDFYIRHKNYENLVKEITQGISNKEVEIKKISLWVYENIQKVPKGEVIIDSHPWTVVERRLGVDEQFSDILSVLLFHQGIDSFFSGLVEEPKLAITFFKYKDYWSIMDPYYGIYFLDKNGSFSSLDQNKNIDWNMYHLIEGKVNAENYNKIFTYDKFNYYYEVLESYQKIINDLPSNKIIDQTNIYERGIGNRSYIQKPIHRLIYQLRVLAFN